MKVYGELLNGAFRAGLLRETRDYRQGNGPPERDTTTIAGEITEHPYHF